MNIVRFANKNAWIKETSIKIENFLKKYSESVLALSGGATPYPIYQYITLPPEHTVHLIQVDERVVPPTNAQSNQKHILEAFPPTNNLYAQYHLISVQKGWKKAAKLYGKKLIPLSSLPRLCLLGLGQDGHFASIFPKTEDILPNFSRKHPVIATQASEGVAIQERISLTTEYILQSEEIYILIGPDKQDILQKIQMPHTSSYEYPAKILLEHPNLTVFTYPLLT